MPLRDFQYIHNVVQSSPYLIQNIFITQTETPYPLSHSSQEQTFEAAALY